MPSFNSLLNNKQVTDNDLPLEYSTPNKQANLLSKVFIVMFLSLIFTAGLSYGIAVAFNHLVVANVTNINSIYIVCMLVSIIGLFLMAFILPSAFARNKHSVLPAYVIFMIFMSVLISTFYLMFDLYILIITFGVTGAVFGVMALIGFLSNGNLNGSIMLIGGLSIGCLILGLVNLFVGSNFIAWCVSFGIFAIILFVTMLDVRHVKDIIYSGSLNSYNLVLYGSFILYLDFIDIFIRMLPYIVRILEKSKD